MRTQSFIVRVDLVYDDEGDDDVDRHLTQLEDVNGHIEECVHQGDYTIVAMTDVPYVEE